MCFIKVLVFNIFFSILKIFNDQCISKKDKLFLFSNFNVKMFLVFFDWKSLVFWQASLYRAQVMHNCSNGISFDL